MSVMIKFPDQMTSFYVGNDYISRPNDYISSFYIGNDYISRANDKLLRQ